MIAHHPTSRFVLSGVRDYVRLLVATIVILSSSLIAYLYWHGNLRSQLEEVANHYHLASMLYCAQVKEEVLRNLPYQAGRQFDIQRSDGHSLSPSNYSDSIYLLEKYTQSISQLHDAYGVGSDQEARFEPIIRKASSQLARINVAVEEAGATGTDPFVNSGASMLRSFIHSIEQLRRLHAIARDEINSELDVLKDRGESHLLAIFSVALLLGALMVWGILRKIRGLLAAQRQTESILRQSSIVFDNAAEGVVITDTSANITAVNRALTTITGYSETEVLGKNPSILKSGRHDREFYKTMWSSLLQQGEWRGEIWDRRKNGEVFPKWQTISAVRDDRGSLTHYVSVFSDISRMKESEEQLHHLAHHDTLTALPNRLLLNTRLEHSLQRAHREGTQVAVLFLDLDHFKKVNDSLGHAVGDHLLQLVANRLLVCVREEDTVARLGGDELTIVLGHLDDARRAATVAEAVRDKLSEPFELEGQDVFVSASIGISVYPQDGRDATTLLKNADAAMYMAKSEGRNGYHFYSKELTLRASESLALASNLHRAVEREELLLHFQPQVSLQSGDIVGVEARVR